MKLEKVEASGEYVILKCLEQKEKEVRSQAGLILPAGMQKTSPQSANINGENKAVALIVHSIGNAVPEDKISFKIGDEVVMNQYDAQYIGDDELAYCITRWTSIAAIVVASRD
jgi:co-chaperonin GroES (HSP10)